ncbi:hypothetical protein HNR42_003497 [Deinobacterium chartae]|uniref:Uncharacterized protein n=1 Tax=Deinobacterium chartae TaxID=521158 RepID=A0A841I880_9DEIO|nr:hypothetical protein [Deinobacterium chartae]
MPAQLSATWLYNERVSCVDLETLTKLVSALR